MDLTRLSLPQRISLGAAVVVVFAAFLPWAAVFGVGVSGIEGDGVTTLALAVTGVILLLTTSGAIRSADKVPE